MTYDARAKPHQINPLDAAGATLPDGTHVIKVVGGVVDEFYPTRVVVTLPAGSGPGDVPAGTPDQALIIVKA
jgi:hypothetical protein